MRWRSEKKEWKIRVQTYSASVEQYTESDLDVCVDLALLGSGARETNEDIDDPVEALFTSCAQR